MQVDRKTRITIYIDDDVLETFRQLGDAAGKGYQTTMNPPSAPFSQNF
jgi:uncharacterized protein (DUF4415 family)